MDFESSKEQNIETISSQEESTRLENLSRLDEFRNTEKIVRPQTETGKSHNTINGVKDRVFTKKVDAKLINIRKRVKIFTSVYICVLILLLGFVVSNLITQIQLNKQVDTNSQTINALEQELENQVVANKATGTEPEIIISVPEQRAYTTDDVELSFWDKLTAFLSNIIR